MEINYFDSYHTEASSLPPLPLSSSPSPASFFMFYYYFSRRLHHLKQKYAIIFKLKSAFDVEFAKFDYCVCLLRFTLLQDDVLDSLFNPFNFSYYVYFFSYLIELILLGYSDNKVQIYYLSVSQIFVRPKRRKNAISPIKAKI